MEIINFENQDIRPLEQWGETWYSVTDVIAVLTNSADARNYWKVLKSKLKKEGSELVRDINQLKLVAGDGKKRNTDCLNREGLFRLVQSVPSPNAEPFKRWLSSTGAMVMEEQETPELIYDRLVNSYKSQGRDQEWIKLRLRSIMIRNDLTDTWKDRGVHGSDYASLMDTIHKGTFELTTGEHKANKGLSKRDGLRDNMSNMELLFLGLGEEITRQLADKMDAQGFDENREAAKEGGVQAGGSRKRLEEKLGIKTITANNYKQVE